MTSLAGVWRHLLTLIEGWRATFGHVFVVTGPVFDFDADGLVDSDVTSDSIPSHFFAVVLRCSDATDNSCHDDVTYTSQAFVIPHARNVSNCLVRSTFSP